MSKFSKPTKFLIQDSPHETIAYANGAHTSEWAGFPRQMTSKEAREYMERELSQGWPEGANAIEGALKEVQPHLPENFRLKIERGHCFGFAPDVAALYQGRPDVFCLINKRPKARSVRVVVETATSGGYGPEDLVWAGAVCCALVSALEASNVRTEVWTSNGTSEPGQKWVAFVNVKRCEDPLLIDMLAATTISPRFYRFGILGSWDTMTEKGLARFGGIPIERIEGPEDMPPNLADAIVIRRVMNRDDAIEELKRVCAMLEVESGA
jgi:hypothetical protein